MNLTKKLRINTRVSLIYRIVTLLYNLILPRLILLYFGSQTNGLVASISNFLNIITFLDLGVGAVVESSLYKPLSDDNFDKINQIMTSSRKHFRKIAYALLFYIFLLIIILPRVISSGSLSIFSISFLIVSLSISKFAQYYFGIVNELLLNADLKGYIQLLSEIVVLILNLGLSIILMVFGASISVVIFISSLIYLIRPIYLNYYVNKNYRIIEDNSYKEDPIPQKWNGVAQHIAYTVQNSLDTVILTIFSTLGNVSIYTVYNLVVLGLNSIIHSLTNSLKPFFGNLLAKGEIKLLNYYFDRIEWIIHTIIVFLFSITIVMIIPFVELYTSGVEDLNYYVPLFSFILVLSQAIYCIRIPYNYLIQSAGHFRETQLSSVIEVIINLVISLILVHNFELTGVALGTLVSMIYRTLYLVIYLNNNILHRNITKFVRQIFVDILSFTIIVLIGSMILGGQVTILSWVINASMLGIIALIVLTAINLFFYKDNVSYVWNKMKSKFG